MGIPATSATLCGLLLLVGAFNDAVSTSEQDSSDCFAREVLRQLYPRAVIHPIKTLQPSAQLSHFPEMLIKPGLNLFRLLPESLGFRMGYRLNCVRIW